MSLSPAVKDSIMVYTRVGAWFELQLQGDLNSEYPGGFGHTVFCVSTL